LRFDSLSAGELYSGRTPVLNQDGFDSRVRPDFSPMLLDILNQRLGQLRRPAQTHLRLTRGSDQRRDAVSEALEPQIHLAQAVEEQEARPNHVIFELAFHEFQGRER